MASKNSSGDTYGKGRTRNYATVVYPDSAPDNWMDILAEQFVPILISPLHDSDVNPDGEAKKPHYHVLIAYDNVKTIDQAKSLISLVNGVGCEIIQSLRGYARYLCHLDNPEKYQYNQDKVRALCGADYSNIIGLATDKYKALGEMQDFCEKYNVSSFYALSQYARKNRYDWYRILCDCGAIFMREHLKSRKWSLDNGFGDIVDPETGEIL